MKSVCILLLIFGLAAAKPHENVEEELKKDEPNPDVAEKNIKEEDSTYWPRPTYDYNTDWNRPTQDWNRPTQDYNTDWNRPTQDYNTDWNRPTQDWNRPTHDYNTDWNRPTPDYGPKPTGQPHDFWGRFMHFLLVKSVHGVKPDEHPDLKYIKPGGEFIDELFNVKAAIFKLFKPLMKIGRLMKDDHIDMMQRVHAAVMQNNIEKAKHVVGEYFIALQRRMAMFVVEASQKGLFDQFDKDLIHKFVKRGIDHVQDLDDGYKFILSHFNQYRVSDGLLDAPFVKMIVEMAKAMTHSKALAEKNGHVYMMAYIDLISRMVHQSVDMHNHDAAVLEAGASVLSFIRRETKAHIALARIYAPKKCY